LAIPAALPVRIGSREITPLIRVNEPRSAMRPVPLADQLELAEHLARNAAS
jgi:hypothetical protein